MKKEKELFILSKVLDLLRQDNNSLVELSEAPDFLIKDNSDCILGVEITELYLSDTHAKISTKTNYMDELLFIKSQQNSDLKVCKLENILEYCSFSQDHCVEKIISLYSKEVFIEKLYNLLLKKEYKYQNYLKKCNECILIIYFNNDIKDIFKNAEEIKNHLNFDIEFSKFKEIYLVSKNDIYLLKSERTKLSNKEKETH